MILQLPQRDKAVNCQGMPPLSPLCLSVCFSTSGSRKVNTISATSSLPDSSLHIQGRECVCECDPHPSIPPPPSLLLPSPPNSPSFPPSRVFCLMCQCVDDIGLSPNLLSCLLVCCTLHRLQHNVLQVGVHCTLVHTHHLVGHNRGKLCSRVHHPGVYNLSTLYSCDTSLFVFLGVQ